VIVKSLPRIAWPPPGPSSRADDGRALAPGGRSRRRTGAGADEATPKATKESPPVEPTDEEPIDDTTDVEVSEDVETTEDESSASDEAESG